MPRARQPVRGGGAVHADGAGVADLGEQRAEDDHALHLELLAHGGNALDVRAPCGVRFDAGEEDDVTVEALGVLGGEEVGRPLHAALAALQPDLRPDLREVVEPLRVDVAQRLAAPAAVDEADGAAGRFPRVIPALKPGDEDRAAQRRSRGEAERFRKRRFCHAVRIARPRP